MNKKQRKLKLRLISHLEFIYPQQEAESLADKLIAAMALDKHCRKPKAYKNHWNQADIIGITYGDSFVREGEKPLLTLQHFMHEYFSDVINSVHILPFYPYSSDDGFAVINYKEVNQKLGDWEDIEAVAEQFKLMADLVVNHCSSRSQWFEQFKQCKKPGRDYFITVDPDEDLSMVIRPRTNDLLRAVETAEGVRHVWCTFSHDQVDLNFRNPDMLLEMVDIIRFYMDRGVKIFRLDAVAFLWKEPGTSCLNLPQTHEMVRLFRTLIEHKDPGAVIITETNIPNRENLAYFGNANEAHVIYNFALPPLLLHALISGNNFYLNNWLMSMPPAMKGTAYLNFIASHDGIGLRPVEGILTDQEITEITDTMQQFGGMVSWRKLSHDEVRAYEVNISLYDALSGTVKGQDEWQLQRFICAHIIMLGLEGIPAFYIHSLLGTRNDYQKVEQTGNNRAINRHVWDFADLSKKLHDPQSEHSLVLSNLRRIIDIRTQQSAFHPNATQYTLHLGEGLFAFWRQSRQRDQSIFCIHNISDCVRELHLRDVNLIETHHWCDLLNDRKIDSLNSSINMQPYECLWLSNACGR